MDFTTTMKTFLLNTTYSLILATDKRGGIGLNNGLPWKGLVDNKSDMKWFRENTKGKIVVMGYNTWVSIGSKPLPGRTNIVLTKAHVKDVAEDAERFYYSFLNNPENNNKTLPIVKTASTPEDVRSYISSQLGVTHHGGEVMVMGGAQIYNAFIEYTSRIYLTTFDGEFEADTFVDLDLTDWDLRYRDNLQLLEPKFEIWDCTEESAKRSDVDTLKISYGHKPATVYDFPHPEETEDNV